MYKLEQKFVRQECNITIIIIRYWSEKLKVIKPSRATDALTFYLGIILLAVSDLTSWFRLPTDEDHR